MRVARRPVSQCPKERRQRPLAATMRTWQKPAVARSTAACATSSETVHPPPAQGGWLKSAKNVLERNTAMPEGHARNNPASAMSDPIQVRKYWALVEETREMLTPGQDMAFAVGHAHHAAFHSQLMRMLAQAPNVCQAWQAWGEQRWLVGVGQRRALPKIPTIRR